MAEKNYFSTFDSQNKQMMKKNYPYFVLALFAFFMSTKISAQNAAIRVKDDYASIPNGTTTTIAIQDVLDNDTFNGMPATLSNVSFTGVSSSSNALTLDENTGSVIFSNGPVPVGTYEIEYYIDQIGSPTEYNLGHAYVNIGCDELNAPIITSVTPQSCSNTGATVTVSGLPAGGWILFGPYDQILLSGTGTTATLNNVSPWVSWIKVENYQGCYSPPAYLNVSFLNASMVGHYTDTNTDGVPSAGDVIHYSFNVTNNSACTITNITRMYGEIPAVGTIASLAPGATDTTSLSYDYTLTQADINAGLVNNSVTIAGNAGSATQSTYTNLSYINNLNMTDGIKLIAFADTNANGIQDLNEPRLSNGQFTYQINNDGVTHNLNAAGFTNLYEVNPANSYDISFSVYTPYQGFYGVAPSLNNITVPNGSGITTYYFPVTATPYEDLGLYMYGSNPRPGFAHTIYLYYTNYGAQPMSGTVTFHNIDGQTITGISVPGTVPTADGFTYNFSNLGPNQTRHIYITLQTPTIPTVALGDLVHFQASIAPTTNDIRLSDNQATLTQTIVGSYDPNEKYETHGGRVVHATFGADDYLTYTITFENTGTANAEFVRITDELDSKLDETSLMMINASHSYTLNREGSTLTWFFDDIQLPPSVANTNIGHGFVTFQIKPKAGYALGDVIPNMANIYFDFNPAIVTNTCTTEFVPNLANNTFALDQLQYAPNPVQNQLSISNNTPMDKISITTTLGQVVLTKNIQSTQAQLDMTSLAPGVYFVKAEAQKQSKIFKIVKE